MNKEIEEIHEIIAQKCGTFDDPPHCYECEYVKDEYPFPFCKQWLNAEALYNAGYHKIVWHKVSDEDLPELFVDVLCQFGTGDVYGCGFYNGNNWCVDRINPKEIPYAWTEIPKHK